MKKQLDSINLSPFNPNMFIISGEFLKEQVEAIKELGDLVTKMKRVGEGYGLYQLDKDMAE